MNVELVFVWVENKSELIKLLVPLIGAIIGNSYDSGFRFIYIILETPGIHWSAHISIMQQTGATPSATTMPTKVKKSVSHMVNGITI